MFITNTVTNHQGAIDLDWLHFSSTLTLLSSPRTAAASLQARCHQSPSEKIWLTTPAAPSLYFLCPICHKMCPLHHPNNTDALATRCPRFWCCQHIRETYHHLFITHSSGMGAPACYSNNSRTLTPFTIKLNTCVHKEHTANNSH